MEKKWLVLALHEAAAPGPKGSAVPGRAGASKEPLGRVVVDLADFAAEDGRATRAFAVAFSSPAVKAAVGGSKMLLTIGCSSLICYMWTRSRACARAGWGGVNSNCCSYMGRSFPSRLNFLTPGKHALDALAAFGSTCYVMFCSAGI